jgi:hypothetical protein
MPPVKVSQPGLDFIALDAGRTDSGLKATVQARNGVLLHSAVVALGSDRSRAAYAGHVPDVPATETERALIALHEQVEVALREREAEQAAARSAPPDGALYVVQDGRIYWRKQGRDGVTDVPLCNFVATIAEEITTDDGAEQRGELVIAGTLHNGMPLPVARVPLTRFTAINWVVEEWGTRAVVGAGMGTKDRLREAIQLLSPDVVNRREYAHSGWRRVNEQWVYLHAGGAIGETGIVDGVEVRLSGSLARLILPAPPEGDDLIAAVQTSLAVLDVAPDPITATLLGAVYRAPLCAVRQADLAVHLAGQTGVHKSELAALAQQHYGAAFDRLHLPAAWSSTPNALERGVFEAKDALYTVDDFAPHGTQQEIARLHATADRLIRGAGNGAGRGRMYADGRLRPDYPPRGIILSTGEEIPRGQSLRGRMAIVEVAKGDVDLTALTAAQADAASGAYTAAMAGFLRWLASRLDALRDAMPTDLVMLREQARRHAAHARTPDIVANLFYGWQCFLTYAEDAGAITADEHAALFQRVWRALGAMAAGQEAHQRSEEPTQRFLDLVLAAIQSWEAHVATTDGQVPERPEAWGWKIREVATENGTTPSVAEPKGRRIGWLSGDHLYLQPEAAYNAAQKLAQSSGAPLAISPRTLGKRLHERGLLREHDPDGYTVKRVIEGRKARVLCLHIGALSSTEAGTSGTNLHSPHPNGSNSVPDSGLLSGSAGTYPGLVPAVAEPRPGSGTGQNADPGRTSPYRARANPDVPDVPASHTQGTHECAKSVLDRDRALCLAWVEAVAKGLADDGSIPESTRAAALRLGFLFDAFAVPHEEAKRLLAHLKER